MSVNSESDASRRHAAIAQELERLEESAAYSSQTQFEQAKFWRSVNLVLGVPGSVLAAISGATALASTTGRFTAGILALVSAGFGTVLTTVNASHRVNQSTSAANAYLEIQTAARQTRHIDLPALTAEQARATLAELTARRDDQNRAAEPPGRRIYRRAQANLEQGGQRYAVDERRVGDDQ